MEVNKLFSIHKLTTSPYHPACNSQVERLNRTLLNVLTAYTARSQKDWDHWLNFVLFAYRCSVHESTDFSPFELLYGREPRMPSDYMYTTPPIGYMDPPEYKNLLSERLRTVWEAVSENLQRAQLKQEK